MTSPFLTESLDIAVSLLLLRPKLQSSTDGYQIVVVRCIIYWLYDGVRALCIQWKRCFEFWILIFPQTGDLRPGSLLWHWTTQAATAPSWPWDHEDQQATLCSVRCCQHFLIQYCIVCFSFPAGPQNTLLGLLFLARRTLGQLFLRWNSK